MSPLAASQERQLTPDQVIIYGQRYPIAGMVTRKSVTPFPPKTTTGEYGRQDRVVESEWVLSDFSGGLGIKRIRPNRDVDRYEIGNLEVRYQEMSLGPLVNLATGYSTNGTTLAGTLNGSVDLFCEFNNSLWCVIGSSVYQWDNINRWWRLRKNDLTGNPASMIAHDGRLYVLTVDTGGNLFQYSLTGGGTWTSLNSAMGGYALCSFDDKLWVLDSTNTMRWALPGDGIGTLSFTPAGKLLLPAGFCRQLITYFDQTGDQAIHAITRIGVFAYDPDTQKFFETPLSHPNVPGSGKGACVWQGALYVPVGASIYRYTGNLVQSVGVDKDEGMPAGQQGDTVACVASHAFHYAIINGYTTSSASSTSTVPIGVESYDTYGSRIFSSNVGAYQFSQSGDITGSILVSTGSAWHQLPAYQAETDALPRSYGKMTAATVSGADEVYRLWYSDDKGIYYIDLSKGLHNPLNNPNTKFAKRGFLRTARFDAEWAEIDKLALSVDAEIASASLTEKVEIYVYLDGNPVTVDGGPFATVTAPGSYAWRVNDAGGRKFREAQIEIVLSRGENQTATPRVKSVSLGYMRLPRYLRGWEVQLDLTDPRCLQEIGVPAGDLIEKLFDALESGLAGTFTYRYPNREPRTRRVKLREVIGSDMVGDMGGRYSALLVETDI